MARTKSRARLCLRSSPACCAKRSGWCCVALAALPAADLRSPSTATTRAGRTARPAAWCATPAAWSAPGCRTCCSTCSASRPTGGSRSAGYVAFWGYRRIEDASSPLAPSALDRLRRAAGGERRRSKRLRLHGSARRCRSRPAASSAATWPAAVRSAARLHRRRRCLLLTAAAVGFSLFTGISWLRDRRSSSARCSRPATTLRAARLGAAPRPQDRRSWRARSARPWCESREASARRTIRRCASSRRSPQIKKSERVQKEKQAPLFEDLPDTPLPPLKLLDEAEQRRRGR